MGFLTKKKHQSFVNDCGSAELLSLVEEFPHHPDFSPLADHGATLGTEIGNGSHLKINYTYGELMTNGVDVAETKNAGNRNGVRPAEFALKRLVVS